MNKKHFYFWTLLAAALFTSVSLLSSCGDDDEEDENLSSTPEGYYPAVPPREITGDALKLVGSWTREGADPYFGDYVAQALAKGNTKTELYINFKQDGTFTDWTLRETEKYGTCYGVWSYDSETQILSMTYNNLVDGKPYSVSGQWQYEIRWSRSDDVVAIMRERLGIGRPCTDDDKWGYINAEGEDVFLRWPNAPAK